MRRIAVLRGTEWLSSAFETQAASDTPDLLRDHLWVPGDAVVRKDAYPVRIPAGEGRGDARFRGERGNQYVVVVEVEDERAAEAFERENAEVEALFADPQIEPFPSVCPGAVAVGTDADVVAKLNLGALHGAGCTGKGVKIIVVDAGIDGTRIHLANGWTPRPGVDPGAGVPLGHGTMVAFDARIAAPDAEIWDYPLLREAGTAWIAFISDAIRAFSEIMVMHLQLPGPKVVVDSWGMYDTSGDAPIGHPQNYSRNPAHPFNQITGALAGSGVDVVFAAGNCGSGCPAKSCGAGDVGAARSIHGANSHPAVVSVAAATVQDDHLGYSSEGPGGLSAQTPDITGFSHFRGLTPIDGGTSAACPVVGGVLAALRSSPRGRTLPAREMKRHLLDAARRVHGAGWSPQYGWGIVDADAAFARLP
ncbi:MAG TPA: S8 family serine peptidase [Longimicrobium sp.]|nr:S8 family serine peptidase [Longimicrobium sp.]